MKKNILLAAALLTGTLIHADSDQSGVFIGVDISSKKSNVDYSTNNANWKSVSDISQNELSLLSYKLGYQYYFTRIYARIAEDKYIDKVKNRYEIRSTLYEINVEYLPIYNRYYNKDILVRGIFGAGVGYTNNTLSNTFSQAEEIKKTLDANSNQKYMEYGLQVGLMIESSSGLSGEVGARYRTGNLLEYTDSSNQAAFNLTTIEAYLGINYRF